MGTNYYVELSVGGQAENGPFKIATPAVTLSWHICKSMTMFQGSIFNSWAGWKHFLWENRDGVTIRDENGAEFWAGKFIEEVEATGREARSRQFRWMEAHHPGHGDWLDPDGFSFTGSEFC